MDMSVPVGDTALDAEVAMGLFKQLNDISLEDSLLALFMQAEEATYSPEGETAAPHRTYSPTGDSEVPDGMCSLEEEFAVMAVATVATPDVSLTAPITAPGCENDARLAREYADLQEALKLQVESDGEFARKLQNPEGEAEADGGEEGAYGGEDGACGGRLAGAADDEHWRQQVAFDEEIARELQNPRDEAELDGDQLDVTSDDQRWLQQLGTGDLLDRPDSFEALSRLAAILGDADECGLNARQMALLPTSLHRGDADDDADGDAARQPCTICLATFQGGDSLRTLPCCHHFHTACIDPWIRKKAECPVCRKNLLDLLKN